jgi:hypothetical protein
MTRTYKIPTVVAALQLVLAAGSLVPEEYCDAPDLATYVPVRVASSESLPAACNGTNVISNQQIVKTANATALRVYVALGGARCVATP